MVMLCSKPCSGFFLGRTALLWTAPEPPYPRRRCSGSPCRCRSPARPGVALAQHGVEVADHQDHLAGSIPAQEGDDALLGVVRARSTGSPPSCNPSARRRDFAL